MTDGFAAPVVWVPVATGLALLLAIVVLQRLRADALMPIRPMLRSVPVTGLVVAMLAGAVFVAATQLVITVLVKAEHARPLTTGLLSGQGSPGWLSRLVFSAGWRGPGGSRFSSSPDWC